ncbi:MAG: NAD+ synthase, partial [Euryarchaeota archaeon]
MGRSIALLQGDSTVGDLVGNAKRIESLAKLAESKGAVLALSTELAICGYPPRDLLLQPEFVHLAQEQACQLVVGIPVLVGTPLSPDHDKQLPSNGVVRCGPASASSDHGNRIVARKQLLPTYDVFDEARYFKADNRPGIARTIAGLDLGVTVCEDAWQAAGMTPSSYAADPIES